MRTRGWLPRFAGSLACLGLASCGAERVEVTALSTSASSLAPGPAPSARPTAEELAQRFSLLAVDPALPAQRALFTWTTTAQVEAMRREGRLLVQRESPTQGPSFFHQVLGQHRDEPLAALLLDEAFARVRFAWPVPWATLHGPAGESYGDALVLVTLRAEAVVASLRRSDGRFHRVESLTHEPVSLAELEARPERLAAVFFVDDVDERERAPYREYVLVNEAMIESFEVGTELVRDATRRMAAELRKVAELTSLPPAVGPRPAGVPAAWRLGAPPGALGEHELTRAFEGCLAFTGAPYALTPRATTLLADELERRAAAQPPALVRHPAATFPGLSSARRPAPAPPPGAAVKSRPGWKRTPGWRGTF